MKKTALKWVSATLVGVLLGALATPAMAKSTFTFGIVPQQGGSKLSRLWTPILLYLEERTGYTLKFATARNIPTFEQRLHQGKYDFSYMNPYHYTEVNASSGYRAFAKAKDKRLKGILVVAKDSPINSLDDLDNVEVALPANAFAANQIPRAVFEQKGISVSPNYVSSHDSVYRNVAKGRYPVGGGVMRTFRNTAAEYRDKLRILWTSDGYTPHAFAFHPRVDEEAVNKLQQAMLDMQKDPHGRALLKSIRLKGIEAGSNPEWDDVRALNIQE